MIRIAFAIFLSVTACGAAPDSASANGQPQSEDTDAAPNDFTPRVIALACHRAPATGDPACMIRNPDTADGKPEIRLAMWVCAAGYEPGPLANGDTRGVRVPPTGRCVRQDGTGTVAIWCCG